jgi:hypothetical protein
MWLLLRPPTLDLPKDIQLLTLELYQRLLAPTNTSKEESILLKRTKTCENPRTQFLKNNMPKLLNNWPLKPVLEPKFLKTQ